MRHGRAIRVAMGLYLTGLLVLGCDSSSSNKQDDGTQPTVEASPEKPKKNKTTGKMITRKDMMHQL
jgi:hypothetical protein